MPPPLAWGIVIGALALICALDRATALAPVQHFYFPAGTLSISIGVASRSFAGQAVSPDPAGD
jgi:hypothetical protein